MPMVNAQHTLPLARTLAAVPLQPDASRQQWEKEFLQQQQRWQTQAAEAKPINRVSTDPAQASVVAHQPATLEQSVQEWLAVTGTLHLLPKRPTLLQLPVPAHRITGSRGLLIAAAPRSSPITVTPPSVSHRAAAPADEPHRVAFWVNHPTEPPPAQTGGLAVCREHQVSLWLRSQDPHWLRRLSSALGLFKLKLVRLMVNGELIKSIDPRT